MRILSILSTMTTRSSADLRASALAAMLAAIAMTAGCDKAATPPPSAPVSDVPKSASSPPASPAPAASAPSPTAPVAAPVAAPTPGPGGTASGGSFSGGLADAVAARNTSTVPMELHPGAADRMKAAAAAAASPSSAASADIAPLAAPQPEPAPEITEGPVKILYPQQGTLFPPEIVAPTFTWQGGGNDAKAWQITVRSEGDADLRFTASGGRRWRPSEDDWKTIKQRSSERDAEVSIAAQDREESARIKIRTSKDPVTDSLFYREVPLPFLTAVQDPSRIRWRFGTVDSQESPPIVLQNLPVCGNCHSFADDGSAMGLDVDYGNDKGAYAVMDTTKEMVLNDEKIITWADFRKEDKELTFGLLSRVSPDGRYVISTVKDRSVFVAIPDIWFSQLFFPIKGILVVYDRQKKTFTALPGADDPKYVQTNAVWSPDGKEIVFARSLAYKSERLEQQNAAIIDEKDVPEFTRDHKPFRYDLYRIPFNEGKGGKAVPIEGASANGQSNYFAKYSPDGKWIVYTRSNSYMLLQPDSELWIIPTQGGKARRLTYNTARMNSWHSWSSNSRWLVFSSKVNTAYTQLFLTHIDDEGNDTPPVLLERFTSSDRAANIPEFVRLPADAITGIKEEFLDAYSFLRAGMANENTGDHAGAERSFRRGLELNPNSAELRNALGWTLFQDSRTLEAVSEYQKAVALDPKHVKSRNNLALALVERNQLQEAAEHYAVSVQLEPKAEIHSDLGFILARLNRYPEARAEYQKALALDPRCASALFNLAVDSIRAGEYAQAEKYYREALAIKPTAETWNGLGYALARQRRNDEAVEAYREATKADPDFPPGVDNLADALARQGSYAEAETWYRRSLAREPSTARSNTLGAVLRKLGRNDEAAKQFQETLALDPTNAEAVRNLKELQGTQPL